MDAKAIAKIEESILYLECGSPHTAVRILRRLVAAHKPLAQRCADTPDMFGEA